LLDSVARANHSLSSYLPVWDNEKGEV
jgi:hypothetical protein